jgi:hypothetical protein
VVVPTCQGASATGGIGIAIGVIGTGIGDVTGTGRIVIVEEIQTRGAIETGATYKSVVVCVWQVGCMAYLLCILD